jgi:flagellar protein FliS
MSQIELVVTLYQGAIRYLNQGIELVQDERFDQSWQMFDRARRIVIHLCSTLNRDAGDLAGKFASLYAYIIEQIGVANARRDIDVAQNCINILITLKEGWEGLATQADMPPADAIGGTMPASPPTGATESLCVQA